MGLNLKITSISHCHIFHFPLQGCCTASVRCHSGVGHSLDISWKGSWETAWRSYHLLWMSGIKVKWGNPHSRAKDERKRWIRQTPAFRMKFILGNHWATQSRGKVSLPMAGDWNKMILWFLWAQILLWFCDWCSSPHWVSLSSLPAMPLSWACSCCLLLLAPEAAQLRFSQVFWALTWARCLSWNTDDKATRPPWYHHLTAKVYTHRTEGHRSRLKSDFPQFWLLWVGALGNFAIQTYHPNSVKPSAAKCHPLCCFLLLFISSVLERTRKAKASFLLQVKCRLKLLQVTCSYLLEGLCGPSEICKLKKKKSFLLSLMDLLSRILLRVKLHVPSQCWSSFHHVGAPVALLPNKAYWLIFKQVGGLPFCSILCHLSACAGLRKPLALCCSAHTGVWVDRFETTSALNNFLCTAFLQKRSRKSRPCSSASPSLKSLLQVALGWSHPQHWKHKGGVPLQQLF